MPHQNTFVQKRGEWPHSFLTNAVVLHANTHPLFFALIAACFSLLSGGLCNLCGPVDHAKCLPKGLRTLGLQEFTGVSNLDSVSTAELYMYAFEWRSACTTEIKSCFLFFFFTFWLKHLFCRFKKFDNKYLKKILIREHQPKSSIVSLYKKMEIKLAIEMAESAMKISKTSTASIQWVLTSWPSAE